MRIAMPARLACVAFLAGCMAACAPGGSSGTLAVAATAPRGGDWFVKTGCTTCHSVSAHGIWNLARSDAEMRRGMAEAARAAAPGAALFVFTFSRHTLPPEARPIAGEQFVFTEFAGEPQCFLTANQLVEELRRRGFVPDPAVPLRELNRRPAQLHRGGSPVIHEAAFRFAG